VCTVQWVLMELMIMDVVCLTVFTDKAVAGRRPGYTADLRMFKRV